MITKFRGIDEKGELANIEFEKIKDGVEINIHNWDNVLENKTIELLNQDIKEIIQFLQESIKE